MARPRKYFKSKKAANDYRESIPDYDFKGIHVWKMPKGTSHPGMYTVCSELEFLNTY